jgi:hypothetical protein
MRFCGRGTQDQIERSLKPIVTTAGGGIATITLATREVQPLVAGPVPVLVAGHQTGDVQLSGSRSHD